MKTLAEVSIYLRIHDGAALIQAGRDRAIKDGLAKDMAEAADVIEDEDYSTALRMILDPGTPPPGTEILDSACEIEDRT